MNKYISFIFLSIIGLSSCSYFQTGNESNKQDRLLAEVYDQKLYLSQLDEIFKGETTKKDSTSFISNAVDLWIKETLLIKDAEKKVQNTTEIQALVNDYRESLILQNYHKMLTKLQLDTIISQAEMTQYYDSHKDDFVLPEKMYKSMIIQFSRNKSVRQSFKDWWEDDRDVTDQNIMDYIDKNATYSVVLSPDWMTKSELTALLPSSSLSSINIFDEKPHNFKTSKTRYFIHIQESLKKSDSQPMEQVKAKIKKAILRKRKNGLLDEKKKELLKREENKSNIKLHI